MGMPVYNGELYLEEALRSLLSQTFEDFELLISDNASTDRTNAICLDYVSTDRRIQYLRNEENVGFGRNQNRVYDLARTIAILDADDSIVVCYTETRDIDACGNLLPRVDPDLRLDSEDLRVRFRDVIRMDHICEADFGLTRLDVLRKTRLHGDYADSDRVLLAELLMYGRFRRIPECLFLRRAHPLQSTAIAPDRQSRTVWFNPSKKGRLLFPHFRQFVEYLAVLRRAPIGWRARASCFAAMARWMIHNRKRLFHDLLFAARQVVRPLYWSLKSRTQ
jgi:glycosyltransferase involved in cell wall biosynthesis